MLNWITKYRKIIMICLIVVIAIIVLPIITYVTEYNKTKVKNEEIFSISQDMIYKSHKEFEKNFDFDIYCSKYAPYSKDGDTETKGDYKFTVSNRKAAKYDAGSTTVSVNIVLACDWANYSSNSSYKTWSASLSSLALTVGTSTTNVKTMSISNVTTPYPQKGKLLFTTRKTPDLFVMVKWTDKDSNSCYTIYRLGYDDYIRDQTVFN